MKLAIDVFGGDNAPASVIRGCVDALKEYGDFELLLCGDSARIKRELALFDYDETRVQVLDAPEVISCDEAPTVAIKKKKNSSLVRAIELVASGAADCLVSAGSTGAVLAGATFIIKRIPGIKRPALAPILPTLKGPSMLIDCGANVDCKSEYLHQFALMGSAYMSSVVGVKSPRIGLINNGAEESKGNELTKAVYTLLKNDPSLNFVGNCEPREIMGGGFDVLVCDGFVGNAVLKTLEGTAEAVLRMLRSELMSKRRSKFGALFCRAAFRRLKKRMDYTEHGGAPMLGVNGGVIKAHGSSDARAIRSAILQARSLVLGGVTEKIALAVKSDTPSSQDA